MKTASQLIKGKYKILFSAGDNTCYYHWAAERSFAALCHALDLAGPGAKVLLAMDRLGQWYLNLATSEVVKG